MESFKHALYTCKIWTLATIAFCKTVVDNCRWKGLSGTRTRIAAICFWFAMWFVLMHWFAGIILKMFGFPLFYEAQHEENIVFHVVGCVRYLRFSFFSSSRACFSGLGLSGVGWDVDVHSRLLHELDATSRMENKGPGAPTTIRNVVLFSSCVWWQHCMFESASSFETGMSKRWNKKSVKIVQANQSFQPCF